MFFTLIIFINHLILIVMLKYALVENALVTNPNYYVASVSSPEVKDLNDVVDFMIAEGTGLTRPQALAYFEKLTQTVEFFVSQGHRVVTPLVRIRPSISGVFTNTEDYFDSSRHTINIRATSGLRLKELATKIKLEKVDATLQNPSPRQFLDGTSGAVNSTATSDRSGVLKGTSLKFDVSDNRQGVFFVAANDPSNETRAQVYTEIKPSVIHFEIPSLPAGDYKVVAKSLSRNGNTILNGELKNSITI
jgi:hypothetical protein